eukprot:Gb_09914 [translate_table: standard]
MAMALRAQVRPRPRPGVMDAPALHICSAPTFSHLSVPSIHKKRSPCIGCHFNPLNGNGNARNISDYRPWPVLTKAVSLEAETEVEGVNIAEDVTQTSSFKLYVGDALADMEWRVPGLIGDTRDFMDAMFSGQVIEVENTRSNFEQG